MIPLAACAGACLDQVVGEPPVKLHPVVAFAALMNAAERRMYADRRIEGVAFLAVGSGAAIVTGMTLQKLVGPHLATALAVAVCAAGKMLDGEASAVAELLRRGDLDAARHRVRALVGRDAAELDESEISRAVIESVAENSVDAVTSSLVWAALLGAPGVLVHRAINTLDAMVGHHTPRYEHFGWASARLDDVVNFVPARITAVATAIVRPTRAGRVYRVVRRDSSRHPSPNGGVIEASYAAALDVRLGGVNRYGAVVEDRGVLGDGRLPSSHDIARAVELRRHTTVAVGCFLLVGSAVMRRMLRHPATRRRRRR